MTRIVAIAICVELAMILCGCRAFPLRSQPKPILPINPSSQEQPALSKDEVLAEQTEVGIDNRLRRRGDSHPWTGKVISIHPNGRRESELRYRNGIRDGLSTWWTESGWKQHEQIHRAGKLEGSWVEWSENGQPQQEHVFFQGQELGRRGWRRDGTPWFEVTYRSGTEVARKVWNEAGQMTISGEANATTFNFPPPPAPTKQQSIAPISPRSESPKQFEIQRPQPAPARGDVAWEELEKFMGVYRLRGKQDPFTGRSYLPSPDGQRTWILQFRDGKLESWLESK